MLGSAEKSGMEPFGDPSTWTDGRVLRCVQAEGTEQDHPRTRKVHQRN